MARHCIVEVDQLLYVKVRAATDGGIKELKFRFTPTLAQKFADCLYEFSGAAGKSYGRRSVEGFPALLIEELKTPKNAAARVIRLGRVRGR